jgi:hypothetical protein
MIVRKELKSFSFNLNFYLRKIWKAFFRFKKYLRGDYHQIIISFSLKNFLAEGFDQTASYTVNIDNSVVRPCKLFGILGVTRDPKTPEFNFVLPKDLTTEIFIRLYVYFCLKELRRVSEVPLEYDFLYLMRRI